MLTLSALPVNIGNVVRNYDDDDAILEFKFKNKAKAVVRMHPDRQTRVYVDGWPPRIKSSAQFRRQLDLEFVTIPTLAPLEIEEKWVENATVQKNASTRLASRVLRNIWLRATDTEFESFRKEVESAWTGIQIRKTDYRASVRCDDVRRGPHSTRGASGWIRFPGLASATSQHSPTTPSRRRLCARIRPANKARRFCSHV